jgi:hypothetical protein
MNPTIIAIILAWNDLGMHCANKDFQNMAVLPPYNNLTAQVVMKGDASKPPALLTGGVLVTYEIPGNTYSAGKTNFWSYEDKLFGVNLPDNVGLRGNGLTGVMTFQDGAFRAEGIPITPYTDADLVNEDPYQLALVRLLDSGGAEAASTRPVVPVSNEINCVSAGCHSSEMDILNEHEREGGFNPANRPLLCASCHASNALGTAGVGEAPPLSQAVHGKHGGKTNDCYKCHPGSHTKCLRDVMYSQGLKCQDCHGSVSNVASTVSRGRRPWLDEPRCGDCHGAAFAEETGKLYRQSRGHGGLYCSACHGSPHAIQPTVIERDNVQNIALQGFSGPLRDCTVCHGVNPPAAGPHGRMANAVTEGGDRPEAPGLGPNYPNPFNPSTTIPFRVGKPGRVRLEVFDAVGRSAAVLVDAVLSPGEYRVPFDGSDLASGLYSARLTAGGRVQVRTMACVK